MTASLDLGALEERAFRSRFDDGLLDTLIGVFVLLMGLTFGTELGGLTGVWAALVLPTWMPLRKALIEPRIGYVAFGPERQRSIRWRFGVLTIALGVSVLAGVGMWLLAAAKDPAMKDTLRALGPTPFFAMLALLIAVGAGLLHLWRGFVYAALVLGLGAAGWWADLGDGSGLTAAGAVILLLGGVRLARFLRDHPRPPAGGAIDGNG